MSVPFRLEALEGRHDSSAFASGEERLDRYFQTQVTQDIRRHIANCFVAVETETHQVAAYYTIAAACIPTPDLPPEVTKRLPRYPTMPAVRIGRLAVDQKFQGRGLGKALLARRPKSYCCSGLFCFIGRLLVDAKNEQAVAFYQYHGFRPLNSLPKILFLPLATAEKLLLGIYKAVRFLFNRPLFLGLRNNSALAAFHSCQSIPTICRYPASNRKPSFPANLGEISRNLSHDAVLIHVLNKISL